MIEMLESGYRFHVQFHINNSCNLKCKHCYEGNQKGILQWSFDEFTQAVEKLWCAFEKWGVQGEISLIGGEPTLHPEYYRFVDYLSDRGDVVAISILTNGTRIDDKFIANALRNKCTVQVSIDGIDEVHHDNIRGAGNYKKVTDGIKRLTANGIYPSVHYVISKDTIPFVDSFFDNLINLGIKQISFFLFVPFGRASTHDILQPNELKDVYDSLYEKKRKYAQLGLNIMATRPLWCTYGYSGRCPVAIQTITILEDGTIMPCRRLPISIGNIKTDSFFKVWYTNKVLNDLRERQNIKVCGDCQMLDLCGGARCVAYAVTGDYMSADPQCWLIR